MADTDGGVEQKRGVRVSQAEVCELCGAFENLRLCGRCGESYYCSKEHQRDDWKQHKKQCRQKAKSESETKNRSIIDADDRNNIEEQTTVYNPEQTTIYNREQTTVCDAEQTTVCNPEQTTVCNPKQTTVRDPEQTTVHNPEQTTLSSSRETDGGHALSLETEQSRTPHWAGDHVHHTQGSEGIDKPAQPGSVGEDSHARTVPPVSVGNDSVVIYKSRDGQDGKAPDLIASKSNPQLQELTPESSTCQISYDQRDTTYQSCGSGQGSSTTNSSFGTLSNVNQEANMTVTDLLGFIPDDGKSGQSGSSSGTGARPKVSQHPLDTKTVPTNDVSGRPQARGKRRLKDIQNNNLSQEPRTPAPPEETKLADYVVKCMNNYGICVVDNFMAADKANSILGEVLSFQNDGRFHDGQTVQQGTNRIRGDKIAWVENGDENCDHIGSLITRLDSLMVTCKGKLDRYDINGRTKAMVACYPGDGTGYKRHIDNPKGDGRCVTCIYYLNKGWNIKTDGGLLRIFPMQFKQVADIEPKFDRLLFFWSDRRNPHEVQPAYKTRFAITVWYFDGEERKKAKIQHKIQGLVDTSGFQNFEVQSKPQ